MILTSAHHWASILCLNVVRNGKGELLVRTNVTRVSSLAHNAVVLWVWCTVCVDHLRAVVLLVALAVDALSAGTDLSTDTDSLTLLELLDLVTDPDDLADDLVSNTKRKRSAAPSTSDGVNIRAANSASIDSDIDIVLLEGLREYMSDGT